MFIGESVHHPGLGRLLLLPVGLRKKTAEMLSCPAGPSPAFNFVPCDALLLIILYLQDVVEEQDSSTQKGQVRWLV